MPPIRATIMTMMKKAPTPDMCPIVRPLSNIVVCMVENSLSIFVDELDLYLLRKIWLFEVPSRNESDPPQTRDMKH